MAVHESCGLSYEIISEKRRKLWDACVEPVKNKIQCIIPLIIKEDLPIF